MGVSLTDPSRIYTYLWFNAPYALTLATTNAIAGLNDRITRIPLTSRIRAVNILDSCTRTVDTPPARMRANLLPCRCVASLE